MTKYEKYVLKLLDTQLGMWQSVCDSVESLKFQIDPIENTIYASWLPSPCGEDGYVFIIFYDIESGESITAEYNAGRLRRAYSQD
ncbi:hypothetical protein KSF73_14980 [Burkholderiaceae bacterium DAT-1]|nr:hypothetical protein [Burkholderiaceae bacterium DAT-1]